MKRIAFLSACLLVAVSSLVLGQTPASKPMDQMDMKMDKKEMPKSAAANSGTGVVKSVDAAAGSITFAHEPIKSLNWPAMTMAFKVKDKSLLDRAKPGDKVQFTLVQSGKDYVVTSIK